MKRIVKEIGETVLAFITFGAVFAFLFAIANYVYC